MLPDVFFFFGCNLTIPTSVVKKPSPKKFLRHSDTKMKGFVDFFGWFYFSFWIIFLRKVLDWNYLVR